MMLWNLMSKRNVNWPKTQNPPRNSTSELRVISLSPYLHSLCFSFYPPHLRFIFFSFMSLLNLTKYRIKVQFHIFLCFLNITLCASSITNLYNSLPHLPRQSKWLFLYVILNWLPASLHMDLEVLNSKRREKFFSPRKIKARVLEK